MPYGLYIAAEGAHAQSMRLEAIANNLANVDTVGFKPEQMLFQARFAEAIQRGSVVPGMGAIEDVGGGVLVRETKTDFSPGPLKHTRIPTDVAVDGEGFFVVLKDGEEHLTRAGNFRLTDDGALLTQQGYPVLSDLGAPLVIDPLAGPWTITASGTVRQGEVAQDLALVRPHSPNDLVKAGENLFRALLAPEALPAEERRVAAGYLEMSAVQPTTELVELIEASRAVEANVNVMRTHDQMLSGLLTRVLRTR